MEKRVQIVACVIVDFITINAAWTVYFLFRVRSGVTGETVTPDFFAPMLVLYAYWAVLFGIAGLYRPLYAASRLDEFTLLLKTATVGCLILFFVIFADDAATHPGTATRTLMVVYWFVVLFFAGSGRAIVRGVQRRLLLSGVGTRRTLIVGSKSKSEELFERVQRYPALGYRVVGFVGLTHTRARGHHSGAPLLGGIDDLDTLVAREKVREILIALDSTDHDKLLGIISRCNGNNVGMKIIPDLYDIISGQARTNAIHGFPLIEISPQLMAPWEEFAKRLFDLCVSGLVLAVGLPLWVVIAVAIRLDTSGPIFYRQERVGKDGRHFEIVKFRSMRADAERQGARWASRKDPRVTRIGRILRQLHLDEVPQVLNVLKGEMSMIGPRPERPVFVEQLSKDIPLYSRRLKVRPGVTGWAQVSQRYDETIEDVRKKVQYDLFYIENMSLRLDFKIILYTVFHVILGKGR